MMTYNIDSLPSFDFIVFDKISKRKIPSYLLDYVTNEFEAIISCPSSSRSGTITPPFSFSSSVRGASNFDAKNNVYCSDKTGSTFDHSGLPSPPLSTSPQRRNLACSTAHMTPSSSCTNSNVPMPLRSYIEIVMKKSRMDTGTLLTSLCYARRLKLKLFNTSKGMECTRHRIFLATLIIATKYIHDSAIKNKYWIDYSLQLFSGSEINLMEKQLLQLLDYKLEISSHDFELLVNDVVQLHFQHKLEQYQCPTPNAEPCQWYPDKQNYRDSAYQSGPPSQSSFYSVTTPVSTSHTLNPYKPSPPTLHQ
ncbi:PHO85 cyclin-1 [Mucor circinelloides]